MFTKLGRTIAIFLLLSILSPEYAIPAPSDDPCKGKKSERPATCGGEETPGGEHRSLRVTLDYDESGTDQIQGDESDVYSDSEKTVTAALGGQAQPNKPGFSVSLKKAGRTPRQITTEITCEGLPEGGLDNCHLLPNSVTDDQMSLGLRPYESGCPDPDPQDGECPDVFTMETGPAFMSFRSSYWNHNIFVEIASDIGGDGAPNPGRCLALLDDVQRKNFLDIACADPADCNVEVTASDSGDISGAGIGDLENDRWVVSANGGFALICGQLSGSEIVYGMTVLTFDIEAIKE